MLKVANKKENTMDKLYEEIKRRAGYMNTWTKCLKEKIESRDIEGIEAELWYIEDDLIMARKTLDELIEREENEGEVE